MLRLGVFYLQECLATGVGADVYRAVHPATSRSVAVKLARRGVPAEAMMREAQAAARLLHPAVVRIIDVDKVGHEAYRARPDLLWLGQPFMVMELGQGSLRTSPPRGGFEELRRLLLEILSGLAHAHARSVIHLDLKPSNLLYRADGRSMMIGDFELARIGVDGNVLGGTPGYMAPEQEQGRVWEIGPPTDLFALGTIALEVALGHQGGRFDRPRMALSPGFEAWTERMRAPHPAWRFHSAAEAAAALRALPVAPDAAPRPTAPVRWAEAAGTLRNLHSERDAPTRPGKKKRTTTQPIFIGDPPPCSPAAGDRLYRPKSPPAAGSKPKLGRPAPSVPTAFSRPLPEPAGVPPLPHPVPCPPTWRSLASIEPLEVVGAGLGLFGLRALPTVGRMVERDALWAALYDRIHRSEGAPGCALVFGATGVGKSHLIDWFGLMVEELGVGSVLRVQAGETEWGGHVLRHALRVRLGCTGDATRDEPKIRRGLSHLNLTDDPRQFERVVRSMLPVEAERAVSSSPAAFRAITTRVLLGMCRHRPLVCVVDNLHRDLELLEELEHVLSTASAGDRIFVLATVDTDEMASGSDAEEALVAFADRPDVRPSVLEALGHREHRRFVRALLPLREPLCDRLAERTEGNPLFAVQLVGHWVSRGLLKAERGGLDLTRDVESHFPDDLHALWSRRLDRLLKDRGHHVAILLAALIGRTVDLALWREAASRLDIEFDQRAEADLLARLQFARLATTLDEGARMRFEHAMLVEALVRRAKESGGYASLHAAIADALAARRTAGHRMWVRRLAQHLRKAQRFEEALPYYLRAAREALDEARLREATSLLDEHRDLTRTLGLDLTSRPMTEERVLRVETLNRTGELKRARELAHSICSITRRHGWQDLEARLLRELGFIEHHQGDADAALANFSAAIDLLALRRRPPRPAASAFERGSADARGNNTMAGCLRLRGDTYHSLGRMDEARADFLRARAEACQTGDALAVAAASLGLSLPGLGDAEGARQALTIFEMAGHGTGASGALNVLAEDARAAGRYEEAEQLYRRAREWAQLVGATQHEHICGFNLALALIARGRFEEALVELQLGARMAELLGQRVVHYAGEAVAGAAAIGCERMLEAEAHLRRALELQTPSGTGGTDVPRTLVQAADLALARGRPDLARIGWTLARHDYARLARAGEVADIDARLRHAGDTLVDLR